MVNLLLRVDALPSEAIFCNSLTFVELGFFFIQSVTYSNCTYRGDNFGLHQMLDISFILLPLLFFCCQTPLAYKKLFNDVNNCCLTILLRVSLSRTLAVKNRACLRKLGQLSTPNHNALVEKEGSPGSCNLCHKRNAVIWCRD